MNQKEYRILIEIGKVSTQLVTNWKTQKSFKNGEWPIDVSKEEPLLRKKLDGLCEDLSKCKLNQSLYPKSKK